MIAGLVFAFALGASPLVEIPLRGPVASPVSEISSLTWHGDRLLLVPENIGKRVYFIPKADLLAHLDGRSTEAIEPRSMEVFRGQVLEQIPHLDGIEAAACEDDTIYFVAESRQGCAMDAYLLKGTIDPVALQVTLEEQTPVAMGLPTQLCNLSVESMIATPSGLLVLDEANGRNVVSHPIARLFTPDLKELQNLPIPFVEYRVTDATELDAASRFWVINYLWPPERDLLKVDSVDAREDLPIEQLVELELRAKEVVRTNTPPFDLRTGRLASDEAHNWEGIVRLDARGFLLITDTFPRTVFAFIAIPSR